MAQISKIEWCDATWNPVTGCTKVSEGCANCYAERMSPRFAGRFGYPSDNPFQVTLHADKLDWRWGPKCPKRVFVCSMGDLFHEDVPFEWIDKVFHRINYSHPNLTFLMLTKRPERMLQYFKARPSGYVIGISGGSMRPVYRSWPMPNLWIGVTIELPKYSYRASYHLLECPAAVRFISFEPLLASFEDCPGVLDGIDWVICGAESGHKARYIDPDWVCQLRDRCVSRKIPFFFKGWANCSSYPALRGRLLDNRTWDELPK